MDAQRLQARQVLMSIFSPFLFAWCWRRSFAAVIGAPQSAQSGMYFGIFADSSLERSERKNARLGTRPGLEFSNSEGGSKNAPAVMPLGRGA